MLSEKELSELFLVYKLLIWVSAFIFAIIFLFLSQPSLNVYDFTSSNLSFILFHLSFTLLLYIWV